MRNRFLLYQPLSTGVALLLSLVLNITVLHAETVDAISILNSRDTIINNIIAIPIPGGSPTGDAVSLHESEAAVLTGALVESAFSGYTGEGYASFGEEGSAEWTFDVSSAGLYQLAFRYALGVEGQNRSLDVFGANGILIKSALSFKSTQRWDNWKTVFVFTKLKSGSNTVKLSTTGGGGPHLDHLLVSLTPPDQNKFLSFPINSSHAVFKGSESNAKAYYKILDPLDQKTSLEAWKQFNGFDDSADASADAHAIYLNAADLNFGRSMFVKKASNGDVASYVQNYPTLEDAIKGTNLLATVAMEYGPPVNKDSGLMLTDKPKFTKFYVFGAQGERLTKIDLDGRGEKYVPGLCNVCHGGKPRRGGFHGSTPTYEHQGDTGAKWIPWDLETYRFHPNLTRETQEAEFKKLNALVLDTNPTSATKVLVEGWYGGAGLPSGQFDGSFVPTGWKDAGNDGNKSDLYLKVVAPSCRACHNQRGTYNNSGHVVFQGQALEQSLEFNNFAAFKGYKDEIERLVFDQGLMPIAKRTYELFWRSAQPKILDDELFDGKAHQNPPNSVYSGSGKADFGDLRRPGRPIARIAGARFFQDGFPYDTYDLADVQEGKTVRLNAGPSQFANKITWSFQSAPGSIPTIDGKNKLVATFDPVPGAPATSTPYQFRLGVSNEFTTDNAVIAARLWSETTLQQLNFVDHIYPMLTTGLSSTRSSTKLSCIHCHSNGGVVNRADGVFNLRDFQQPAGANEATWKSFAYRSLLTRVDCKDPENSLIIKKPAGHHHWNGTVNGFANLGNSDDTNNRAKLLRWIMEGAALDASGKNQGCPVSESILINPDIILPEAPITVQLSGR